MPFPKISNYENTITINKNILKSEMTNEFDYSDQLIYLNNSENINLENSPILKLKRKKGGYYGNCDEESTKMFFKIFSKLTSF